MKQNIPKLWLFFFLIIVFLIVGMAVTAPKAEDSSMSPQDTNEALDEQVRSQTFENMLATGENAVFVENQMAGQREVWVGYVVLSKPGFVVIYNNEGGVPSEAIGNSGWLVEGGEHVLIRVEETLIKDDVYYAVVYHDDGDAEFSEIHDTQAADNEDSVVLMTFEAIEDAMIETEPVLP